MGGFAETLGQVVGVIAGLESLRRPGGLSDYFANRLTAQTDPNARAGLIDNPFMAGFYGASGGQRQAIPDQEFAAGDVRPPWMGPGAGIAMGGTQYVPNLPPLGPEAMFKQQAARVGMDLDLARLAEAKQNAAQSASYQKFVERIMGGGGGGTAVASPEGMGLTGMQIGPNGPTFAIGPPPKTTLAAGTIDPRTGKPYPPTATKTAGGTTIEGFTQDKGKQTTAADVNRLRGGRQAFLATFGPDKTGASPLDLLPPAKKQYASGLLRTVPGVRQFTSVGEIPAMLPEGMPGSGISIPRLAREGDPRAAALTKGTVLRSEVARAFGGLGNLNENEQKIVEQILPNPEDTRELAAQKIAFISRLFDAVEAGLTQGQFATVDDAKAALLSGAAAGAAQFSGGESGSLGTTTTTGSTTTTGTLPEPKAVEAIDLGNGFSVSTSPRKK